MTPRPLAAIAVLAAVLAGCRGCRNGEPPPPTPTSAPPATAAATGEAEPQAADELEADCFVIVDAEPDFGAPPLTVNFSTETDCSSEPVAFSWDFGDGTSGGNEPKPSHTYAKAGDFVAVVTVTAPDGARGTDEIDITVDPDLGE
ncbi:MAG: PKD domain-containing protein [Candidatus Binatia bacterium]